MKIVRIWQTKTIKQAADENGGVPAQPVSILNSDCDVVTWMPDGAVETTMLENEHFIAEIMTLEGIEQ
jgi:hypothetical protein